MTRLAAIALGTNAQISKQLLTDAMIDAIGDWRLDPVELGRQMFAVVDRLKLNRTADVLAEVSRVSELHQYAVLAALEAFVARFESPPKNLHFILTVMLESATLLGAAIGDDARAMLATIKGSSKTAKLAKQLLALESTGDCCALPRLQALEASLARAERWSTLLK